MEKFPWFECKTWANCVHQWSTYSISETGVSRFGEASSLPGRGVSTLAKGTRSVTGRGFAFTFSSEVPDCFVFRCGPCLYSRPPLESALFSWFGCRYSFSSFCDQYTIALFFWASRFPICGMYGWTLMSRWVIGDWAVWTLPISTCMPFFLLNDSVAHPLRTTS